MPEAVVERLDGSASLRRGLTWQRLRVRFFAFLGYLIVSLIVAVFLLEFGAYLMISAYHWARSAHYEYADSNPAYGGYPWAAEYWKEERSSWNGQRQVYQPFRIWGVAPRHGKYINTDDTPTGPWRRTVNPSDGNCDKQKSLRVWMFGGSTLYGLGVPDWATIPSFLVRDLNGAGLGCVAVTNFGVDGYVTNQEVILLMEQLKGAPRPDLVIFYDGVNESYAGAVSPGIANAHEFLFGIKARVEGTLIGRLDFIRSSYALQLATMVVDRVRRGSAATAGAEESTQAKAVAAVDNYQANLHIARALGHAYGFRVLCFWQPAFVYGNKPLYPFESRIAGNPGAAAAFHNQGAVYQQAERRASMDGDFVFLGHVFDSVKEPVYIDRWMHLAPRGNELVAQSVAGYVVDSLKLAANSKEGVDKALH
jgi:hypothetical protein